MTAPLNLVTSAAASAWHLPMDLPPIMDGNGAFLGIGAGFTGTVEAELDGAGCGWLEGATVGIDGAAGQP